MDLDLLGKAAVVTGASKGIGLAIVRSLAAEGAGVVAGVRSDNPELAELAGRYPVRAVQVDLTEPDGPARLVDEAVQAFGGVDGLVDNVGAVRPHSEGFLAVSDEDWEPSLTINLLSAVRTTRARRCHTCSTGLRRRS
jgi:NAD(P)-dependent dehydrogenase (short-subunit alcohol dehydrogenase family)